MTKINHIPLFALMTIAVCGCSNHETPDEPQLSNDETQTCTLIMDIEKPSFGENGSRSAAKWEDGDILYLQFDGASATVVGNAVYQSASDEWTLNYHGTLKEDVETAVSGIYVENDCTENNDVLIFKNTSALYESTSGTYFYTYNTDLQEKVLTVKMTLNPKTGRIRFKSDSKISFNIDSIVCHTGLNLKTWAYVTTSDKQTAEIGSDGYSPYIYSSLKSTANSLEISYTYQDNNGKDVVYVNFQTDFQSSKLQPGKSGWMNLPTPTSSNGWTMHKKVTRNGKECVDLGLPSGLLWATCNVGSTTPEGYGNYYDWGETTTKFDYSPTPFTTYGKDLATLKSNGIIDSNNNLTTRCDVAIQHKDWGSPWRMPTLAEFKELVDKCTKVWTTQGGINGYKVTGPNGNSIFLPAAGYYFGKSLNDRGSGGRYWSSTTYDCTDGAYVLVFNSSYFLTDTGGRYNGQSVRAVTEP